MYFITEYLTLSFSVLGSALEQHQDHCKACPATQIHKVSLHNKKILTSPSAWKRAACQDAALVLTRLTALREKSTEKQLHKKEVSVTLIWRIWSKAFYLNSMRPHTPPQFKHELHLYSSKDLPGMCLCLASYVDSCHHHPWLFAVGHVRNINPSPRELK